jgi:hypothetical protein
MVMKNKIVILLSILFVSLMLAFQPRAHAATTKWEKVDVSLTKLLDSGWSVLGHSSKRAAVGNAGAANNYDTSDFTYLLTKDGRYITCILENPRPPKSDSGCRSLN